MQWFYDLKTIHKMYVLIGVMAIFMVVVSTTGYYFNEKAGNDLTSMYKSRLMPTKWLGLTRNNFNAVKADLLQIIITSNAYEKQKLLDDIKVLRTDNNKMLADYEKLSLDSYETETLAKFKESLNEYRAVQNKIIKLALSNQRESAINYFNNNSGSFDLSQQYLRDLDTHNTELTEKVYMQNKNDAAVAKTIILLMTTVSIIVSVSIGWFIGNMVARRLGNIVKHIKKVAEGDLAVENLKIMGKDEIGDLGIAFNKMTDNLHSLVKEVNKSIEEISAGAEEMNAIIEQTAQGGQQVSHSVQQLAAGTDQVSKNISQLSEGSHQVSSSINQLAAGVQQISKNIEDGATNISSINKAIQGVSGEAVKVAKLGNETEDNANTGKEHIKKAVNKIDSIRIVSAEISCTIGELGKLSSEIETIVDLIKNIAGQTNLLALNAAIEAARAGEHGKGFAVVADEVKKLAGQSGDATDKITEMIKEIQNKTQMAVTSMEKGINEVQEGVFVVNDVGQALENIIDQVKQANSKIQSITKEIDEVAKGSEDLVKMVEDISSITEETAASAEEIASITQQTAANAEEISSTIQESAASTEEISSIIEEQTASLEEINASSNSLASIAENLQKKALVFKV